jgi:hypothetical protein
VEPNSAGCQRFYGLGRRSHPQFTFLDDVRLNRSDLLCSSGRASSGKGAIGRKSAVVATTRTDLGTPGGSMIQPVHQTEALLPGRIRPTAFPSRPS